MTKRDVFAELMEGFDALEEARAGNVTLRTTVVERKFPPELSPERRKRKKSLRDFA